MRAEQSRVAESAYAPIELGDGTWTIAGPCGSHIGRFPERRLAQDEARRFNECDQGLG